MLAIPIILLFFTFFLVFQTKRFQLNVSKKALIGLLLGVLLGFILKALLNIDTLATVSIIYNNFSNLYIKLLKMTVTPLVLVSILSALLKISKKKNMGIFLSLIIGVLLIMSMFSAIIAFFTSSIIGISANSFSGMETQAVSVVDQDIITLILNIIPTNPFASLAGIGSNTLLSVVFISFIVGFAALGLKETKPSLYEVFYNNIMSLERIVFAIIKFVVQLTPYFVIPIIANTIINNYGNIFTQFALFFIVAYISVLAVFIMHLVILSFFGYNPITFLKKGLGPLLFAFSTTSSSAALPLSKDTLENKMGVSSELSTLGPTLALTIGQNGCAGIYPAILAFLTAHWVGINPMDLMFIGKLVIIIAIASIGVAGIGGGGTLAALIVLPLMGLPVELVGIFLAIEPLIDMGRTLVNVSGGWVSTLVTAKITNNIHKDIYYKDI